MRPPAKAHDPKRASISVSARGFDRANRAAAISGKSVGKFIDDLVNAYLDEKENN